MTENKPPTEAQASAASNADQPGRPYYEQLRTTLRGTLDKKRKPLEFGGKDDFQLAQAINHLKGLPVQVAKTKVVESKKEPSINDPEDPKKNGDSKK